MISVYREFSNAGEFLARGYEAREWFAHRVYCLPKCGARGCSLSRQMGDESGLDNVWEVVLYATSATSLPDSPSGAERHFAASQPAATASLRVEGKDLYLLFDDTSFHPATDVDRESAALNGSDCFRLLMNAALNLAVERGADTIFAPTAEFASESDTEREVGPERLQQVYDGQLTQGFLATRDERWWRLDVDRNRSRMVVGQRLQEEFRTDKTICIIHYTERGLGHRDVDPAFARKADENAPRHLEEMLRLEKAAGVRATYCVLGHILPEVREAIESGGHAVALHSYDHVMDEAQLRRCREVDTRVKGYSPPRSELTSELTLNQLRAHHFDWLAISWYSLVELEHPALHDRLAVIPIRFDDFPLHSGRSTYDQWEKEAIDLMRTKDFVAFGLHDCYADSWLPHYARLLERMESLARLRTVDEVSWDVFLANSG